MKRKVIIGILCLVIIGIIGSIGVRIYQGKKRAQERTEEAQKVETVQVKRQNLVDAISVTGTIESANAKDVSASAKDVKVLEVRYKVGDYVEKGEVVAVLDTANLELALTEAKNRQALSEYTENKSIQTASEQYEEAVTDGTDTYNKAVKSEGEAKEELQKADGEVSDAAERLKRREERLSEAREALREAVQPTEPNEEASEEEKKAYEEALLAYQELQRAVEEAQASYTEAHQEYNAAAEASEKALDAYETASEALEEAQKNNDRNISDAQDKLEQAQTEHTYSNDSSQQTIENYQEQIDSCTVTAPISGVITVMNVDVGDTYMGEGNALFSIADKEHFLVSASVDEYEISKIAKEMTAAVIVEALGDTEMEAKVSFVSPTAASSNTGSSEYKIEIALDKANTDLRIGMTAKASIVRDAVYDVLTVPYDCVDTKEDGSKVIYKEQDGERVEVPVVVGMESDYYVEIAAEGIDENTQVYYTTPMTNNAANTNEMRSIEGGAFGGPDRGPRGF